MPTTIQDIQNALIKRKKNPNRLFRIPDTPEVYELSEWQTPTAEQPGGYGTKKWIPTGAAFEAEYGKEAWPKVKPISREELGKYAMIGQAPPGYEEKPEIKPEIKPEEEPVIGEEPGAKPIDVYDVDKIQVDLDTAGAEKGKAYDEIMGIQSRLYDEEYNKAGMGDTKTKIASVDKEISDRKAKRDQLMLDEKGKPIPQWMITGRVRQEVDAATADINRSIDQRNSLANQYNKGLEDVTRKVGFGTQDAANKYAHWEAEEKRLTTMLTGYQAALTTELGEEVEAERWEKEFEMDVVEARKPKTSSITYESGGRLYLRTYNAETGETIKTEDLGPAPVDKGGDRYTPTQLRAVDREKEILNDVIKTYMADWPKKGDEGLGTRENLILRSIKEFSKLTPDMIRDAIYEQVTDEWLEKNKTEKKGVFKKIHEFMKWPF